MTSQRNNSTSLSSISRALFPEKDSDTKSDDYYEIYERHFEAIKDNPLNLVELGVLEGQSTKIFSQYFKYSRILALDLHLRPIDFTDYENIVYAKCDQNDPKALADVCKSCFPSGIDLVIDDAAHIGAYSLTSFFTLFPLLSPGGLYVVEDWGTGYWNDWRDGRAFQSHVLSDLNESVPRRIQSHDFGMVGMIKLLIDYVAGSDIRPTYGSPKTRRSVIEMMELHFGTVIIKKAQIHGGNLETLPLTILP